MNCGHPVGANFWLLNGRSWPGAAVPHACRKPTLKKVGVLPVAGYGFN